MEYKPSGHLFWPWSTTHLHQNIICIIPPSLFKKKLLIVRSLASVVWQTKSFLFDYFYTVHTVHTVYIRYETQPMQVMSAFYILSNFLSLFVSIGCYTVISNLNDTVWLNIMFKMFLKVLLRILIRLDPNKFTRYGSDFDPIFCKLYLKNNFLM